MRCLALTRAAQIILRAGPRQSHNRLANMHAVGQLTGPHVQLLRGTRPCGNEKVVSLDGGHRLNISSVQLLVSSAASLDHSAQGFRFKVWR